jgi:quercetin dioxygenase-like cupin family protein
VVLENERVRILRLVLAPGESIDERTHTLRGVRIAVSEGKILIEAPGKKVRTVKLEPGDSQWHEEGTKYSLRNIGSTPFEAVDIELK